jgi:hypothetical protein
MSHREFALMCAGYQDKRVDSYRQTRMLMFTMVRMWADKGPKTPEELWALPGDENKEISKEEQASLLERFSKLPKLNG